MIIDFDEKEFAKAHNTPMTAMEKVDV